MLKIFNLVLVFTTTVKSSYGIGLTCDFGVSTWETVGTIYRCNATSLTIDAGSRESITDVSGTHDSGRTSADVLGLQIFQKGLEYFPVNVGQFFPNLNALAFVFNSIKYVNNQHLFSLANLVVLNLSNNKITSLDSNLFSGLSMQRIDFRNNNITHVGHDFILPNNVPSDGYISFQNNSCINMQASTPAEITALRISLRENCQPNCLPNVCFALESLFGKVKSLTNVVVDLESRNLQLTNEVTELQGYKVELTNEITALTNEVTDLQLSNVELTNEVTEITSEVTMLTKEVTELQESNSQLTNELTDVHNKNSQLETRIGFVDTRARYLEVRVAVLESIIENKLGLKIDYIIGVN